MDFQSAMETFAEAWVAANTKCAPLADATSQSQAMALTKGCRTPPSAATPVTAGASARGDPAERAATPATLPRSSVTHETAAPQPPPQPPPPKDDFAHSKLITGKSIPVHCVVEVINVYEEGRILLQTPWKRRSFVDMDTYVLVPTTALFHEVVNIVLVHLGYSHDNILTAKGSVVIKNWKALSVDQISDDPKVTVEDILGELTTVATLRIQVSRSRSTALLDMKEKLLCFFIKQSRGLLSSAGCPIDEHILSQICRPSYGPEVHIPDISEDIVRKFEQWWSSQIPPLSPPTTRVPSIPPYNHQYPVPLHAPKILDRSITDPPHPAIQNVHNQFPTQKTRMRTSFDPELELPKLQQWFSDNQHPNRQQIQQYVKELNNLESRRGRKPLDMNNVVYWFKNARAAQKRAEGRSNPPVSSHLPINGYNDHAINTTSSLSMTDCYMPGDVKNAQVYRHSFQNRRLSEELSNPSSDMEDELENRSRSPSGPLSLTTSDKIEPTKDSPNPRSISPSGNNCESTKIEPKDEPVTCHSPEAPTNYSRLNPPSDGEDNVDAPEDVSTKQRYHSTSRSEDSPTDQRTVSQSYCGESQEYDSRHLQNRHGEGLERLTAGFPLVPNTMFNHSIMYTMNQYIPALSHATTAPLSADERRKRNRTFIDPVTEVPRLEQWFTLNTHPSHSSIVQYTEQLNCMSYRQKFPRLEPKNVQFWFKNRRAKCKRLKMSLFENQPIHYHHDDRE